MTPGDLVIAGLDEEMQRAQSYAAQVSAADVPLGGKYLKGADTYVFYELDADSTDIPSLLVFVKATVDQYAPTRIFRIGANVSYKEVRWVAVRRGDWPVFATVEESSGPLLYRSIKYIAPPVSDTSAEEFVYRIKGVYRYVLADPIKPTDTLNAPHLPFLAIDSSRLEIKSDSSQQVLT